MFKTNSFFFTITQLVLLFDNTKQSPIKQATTAVKAIGKAVKSPLLKRIGNTLKKPITKTFDNTIKNSMGMFRQNKNTIKNIACGLQEKYLTPRHNAGIKSIKYLGEEGIKKFKSVTSWAARGGSQLVRAPIKKNIYMRSAEQMNRKDLRHIGRKELMSLINMVSKSKPQLPFLAGGSLMRLTQFSVVPTEIEAIVKDQKGKSLANKDKANIAEPGVDITRFVYEPETKGDQYREVKSHMYSDGRIYEGEWLDGERHGKGRQATKNGDVYEGIFVKGVMHGKGKLTSSDGNIYEGDFFKNLPEGKGKQNDPDGNIYTGDFAKGQYHGKGKIINKGGDTYEGDYFEGKMQGEGLLIIPDGSFYEGSFVANLPEGKGKLRTEDGDTYEGDFAASSMEGKGIFRSTNGDMYDGDFVQNQMNGKGKFTLKNGNMYIGEYLEDKKHGYGEYFWKNGNYFKGQWKDDLYDGEGTMHIEEENQTRKGIWEKGLKIEKGKPMESDVPEFT